MWEHSVSVVSSSSPSPSPHKYKINKLQAGEQQKKDYSNTDSSQEKVISNSPGFPEQLLSLDGLI